MEHLAGHTEEARKLTLDRFRLLQPHLEDNRPLKSVAAAAGIPFRSAQRWVAWQYRQFGLAALARKKRTDTGQHREISTSLKEAIEGIALQKPPLPVATIYRMKERKPTATPTNWFTVVRRTDPTPSGRQTTRRSTFY